MARVPLFFWGLTALVGVLWFVSDSLWVSPFAYFPFRSVFVQFSGILAVVMMAVALVLALRLRSLERWVGGLDKVYRLHKWLGIGSLVLATLHWWWAKGTKWMVGWGWLEKPAGKGAGQQLAGLEAWFRGQRGLAETQGEWAFYAAAVNLVIRCSRTEGRLTPEEIRDAVPDWQGASLWFCGPVGMARTLFNEFRRWGLPARRMHREFFEMR